MGRIFFKKISGSVIEMGLHKKRIRNQATQDKLFDNAYKVLSRHEKKGFIKNLSFEELETGKLITWETTNYGK